MHSKLHLNTKTVYTAMLPGNANPINGFNKQTKRLLKYYIFVGFKFNKNGTLTKKHAKIAIIAIRLHQKIKLLS